MTMVRSKKSIIGLASLIVLVVAIVGCTMYGCSSSKSSKTDANLTARSEPSNGSILDGSSSGGAGIKVTASSDASAYVKVKTKSGKTVVGFYVRAGKSAEVSIPAGTYSVQFAMGSTWYGSSDCFGSSTSYGQDSNVSLGNGEVMTYRLQRSTSGNFQMGSLKGSDF